jgi:hypothetical protein
VQGVEASAAADPGLLPEGGTAAATSTAATAVVNESIAVDSSATVSAPATAAASWIPGQKNNVTAGACQLQQLLDDILEQHNNNSSSSSSSSAEPAEGLWVLIEWLAPWADASVAASKQIQQLAAAYPSLPVITVDVTASDANRQLALEKVMQIPQSYRKGGRKFQPVPKSGEKWPCATVHIAPLSHPVKEFSGPQAGSGVLGFLQQSGALSKGRHTAATVAAAAVECSAAPGSQEPGGSSTMQQQQQQQSAVQPGVQGQEAQRNSATATNQRQQQQQQQQRRGASKLQPPGSLQLLKRGAPDLKQLLQQAGPVGVLLVVWTNSGSSSSSNDSSTLPAAAVMEEVDALPELLLRQAGSSGSSSGSSRTTVVATADVGASQANRALAAALKVDQVLPAVQLYHSKQLVKLVKLSGLTAEQGLAKVGRAVQQLPSLPKGEQQQQQQKEEQLQQNVLHESVPAAAAVTATPQVAASSSSSSSEQMALSTQCKGATSPDSSSSSSSIWDPPLAGTKAAKPGAKKEVPMTSTYRGSSKKFAGRSSSSKSGSSTVSAVFWPRMPCLSCGCPWWLGEDWDAACARCGWSCEDDGYDDDSDPLPQYKTRYEEIVAELKQGRTPQGLQPLQ